MIRVVNPGSGFLPILDPGVKKAPDPGSGYATLVGGWFLLLSQLFCLIRKTAINRKKQAITVHSRYVGTPYFPQIKNENCDKQKMRRNFIDYLKDSNLEQFVTYKIV
jgi:hypothetical protein